MSYLPLSLFQSNVPFDKKKKVDSGVSQDLKDNNLEIYARNKV